MTYDLPALCRQIRRDILSMTHAAGSGYPGALSAVEILVSLYFGQMRLDPARPDDPNRDRFLLSKGHAAPLLYSVLARRGYFDPALLPTLRQLGSPLQGHPHMAKLPGLDCSSGSLGQGLSIANGLALASRRTGRTYRTYCLLGTGSPGGPGGGGRHDVRFTSLLDTTVCAHCGRQRGPVGRPHLGSDECGPPGGQVPPLAGRCSPWTATAWMPWPRPSGRPPPPGGVPPCCWPAP